MFARHVKAKYRIEARYEDELAIVRKKMLEIKKKYFGQYDVPDPILKIADNTDMKWLGRCEYGVSRPTSTIRVQRRIVQHERTLDRVVAHELIHHVDFCTHLMGGEQIYRMGLKSGFGGHGSFFKQEMARVNALDGSNFVTQLSDQENVIQESGKEIYVWMTKLGSQMWWKWSNLLTPQQLSHIQISLTPTMRTPTDIRKPEGRLFKVKDDRFVIGAKLGTKYRSPVQPADVFAIDLWEHGTPIPVPEPKPFYVMVYSPKPNEEKWSWTRTLNKTITEHLKLLDSVKIFKTNNLLVPKFLNENRDGKKWDSADYHADVLQSVLQTGEPVEFKTVKEAA